MRLGSNRQQKWTNLPGPAYNLLYAIFYVKFLQIFI